MLKKFLTGVAAVIMASTIAVGANLSILSGPQDPSQLLATINQLVQNINSGVSGRLAAFLTATGTTSTAEISMYSYSLPASQLANDGDAVRVVCWGTSATNSNSKVVKLYFGNSVISTAGTTGLSSFSNVKWRLSMIVMRSGAALQTVMADGAISNSPVAIYTNAGTDTLTAAVTIKCTGTTATAFHDLTAQGMLVEQVK